MKKLLSVWLTFILCGVCSQIAYGQRRSCTEADAMKAESEADSLRTWDALYRSYRHFSHCDDGAISEGYSESVARILADHWETLPRLAVLSHNNEDFLRFVVGHVDATLNMDDVKKIRSSASRQCPAGQNDLCKRLALAAQTAIKEDAEVSKQH